MTMPSDRTRSIIQAREFLVDLSRDKTLPEAVRTEAHRRCAITRLPRRYCWPGRWKSGERTALLIHS